MNSVKKNPHDKNPITNTYLVIITSFQDRDIDLSTSEFRMTMKTERCMNAERFVNDRWTNGERTLNALWTVNAKPTVNAERKTVNDERTMNARWTDGERTVNERKNGKVERFRDCSIHLSIVNRLIFYRKIAIPTWCNFFRENRNIRTSWSCQKAFYYYLSIIY